MIISKEIDSCPKFNGEPGYIDYEDFPAPPIVPNYTFVGYGMLQLDSVEDDDLKQFFTRKEINGKRIEDLEDWFDRDGFLTSVEPPVVDENNKIIEGRGRIEAAIKRKESWIPVLRYEADNPSEGVSLVSSLKWNDPVATNSKVPNTMDDWALTFRKLVEIGPENGGIQDTEAAVSLKLIEMNWKDRFRRTSTRTSVRMKIDSYIASFRKGDAIVNCNESKVKEWYKENITMAGKKNHVLVLADQLRYAKQVIMKELFDVVKNGTDPLNIVLYTKRLNSQEAINNVIAFKKEFDDLYKSIYTHVDIWKRKDKAMDASMGVNAYVMPSNKPYVFAGCVPQILDYHNLDGNKLVKMSDYGKKKNPVPSETPEIDVALGVALTSQNPCGSRSN